MTDLKICDCRSPDDPDLCATHPIYIEACKKRFSEDELATVIQDELFWGFGVRDERRKKFQAKGVPPKKSPFEFPFAICRARQIPCTKKKKKKWICPAIPKKITLEDKYVMTQQEYCNYLAQPVIKPKCDYWRPVKRKKCEIEPCPPRFVQLAIPHKRRVYYNWKCFHPVLTTEMILRLEQILHTDKNLDPRDARWYYKKLDKLKKKCLRNRRKMRRQKRKDRDAGGEKWLSDNIKETAQVIIDYLRDTPLFALNYKQLMLSDAILSKLDERKILKKPKRNTKNHYKRTLVEISDKVAYWMDAITKFVDMQAVEDADDFPPLTISTISEDGEEYESEEEEEEVVVEEEGEFDPWALLEELIRIYRNCTPSDYMQGDVDPMPWIKYLDILDALIWLRDLLKETGPPPPPGLLEEAMVEWLQEISPDRLNEKTRLQIHHYACAIADKLGKHLFSEKAAAAEAEPEEPPPCPPPPKPPCPPPKPRLAEPPPEKICPPPKEPPKPEPKPEPCICPEPGDMILLHDPSFIKEHSPDAICCLSLKIWAVWLLEVCHNAHVWTKWMYEIIRQIKEFAATVRGDIRLPNGTRKVLYKDEWRQFICETEFKIASWMEYSEHVKELSDDIIENFKGKPVYCCPKCLQDHLITDVVAAHETLQSLTEGMNMAQYWRKSLDCLVATTAALTDLDDCLSSSEESIRSTVEIFEYDVCPRCVPPKKKSGVTGKSDDDDYGDTGSEGSQGSYRILQMDPRIQKTDCDCL